MRDSENTSVLRVADRVMRQDLRYLRGILVPFLLAAVAGMILYVAIVSSASVAVGRFGYVLAVAAAAAASGALVGFIFGIPKTLTGTRVRVSNAVPENGTATGDGTAVAAQDDAEAPYGDNTNLEQISDWLTKLLVGATLTQLGSIGGFVDRVSTALADQFGAPSAKAFFGSVVVFWAIHGFFVAYLLTRRVLPMMWRNAHREFEYTEPAKDRIDAYIKQLQRGEAPTSAPEAIAAAAAVPMASVSERDLLTWGRAQTVSGRHDLAVRAFERVLNRAPDDLAAIENLVFSSLYLPPPEGFRRAITEGDRVVKKSPALHVYLAAAYGQKHKWQKAQGEKEQAGLMATEEEAFKHASAACDDETWKPVVRGMLHATADDEDNDLADFAGIERFENLVK